MPKPVKTLKRRLSRDEINRLTSCDQGFTPDGWERAIKRQARLQTHKELFKKEALHYAPSVPKMGRFAAMKDKALAKAFFQEARRLKKRINSSLAQRKIAKRKLNLLRNERHFFIRVDNLAHALTELGREDSFAGKEAAVRKKYKGEKASIFAPSYSESPAKIVGNFFRLTAHDVTQWGTLAKYNCVVYFERAAFNEGHMYGGHIDYNWGFIKDIKKNPILAVQIISSDPKTLMQAAKTMLKRTRNNPVAVLDVFGNSFYP